MRRNHDNYVNCGTYYCGIIVNETKYETNSYFSQDSFSSTYTTDVFDIEGYHIHLVASNLISEKGKNYLPETITLKLYVNGNLSGIYNCSGMGSSSNFGVTGGSRIFFPDEYLIELQ